MSPIFATIGLFAAAVSKAFICGVRTECSYALDSALGGADQHASMFPSPFSRTARYASRAPLLICSCSSGG